MFLAIAWYGLEFAEKGALKYAYIFDLSLYWPYMAVPVAMGLAALQSLLTALRDLGDYSSFDSAEFIE
jgi:TRAP-type C4-dicarboxylate transport system permease small subunit